MSSTADAITAGGRVASREQSFVELGQATCNRLRIPSDQADAETLLKLGQAAVTVLYLRGQALGDDHGEQIARHLDGRPLTGDNDVADRMTGVAFVINAHASTKAKSAEGLLGLLSSATADFVRRASVQDPALAKHLANGVEALVALAPPTVPEKSTLTLVESKAPTTDETAGQAEPEGAVVIPLRPSRRRAKAVGSKPPASIDSPKSQAPRPVAAVGVVSPEQLAGRSQLSTEKVFEGLMIVTAAYHRERAAVLNHLAGRTDLQNGLEYAIRTLKAIEEYFHNYRRAINETQCQQPQVLVALAVTASFFGAASDKGFYNLPEAIKRVSALGYSPDYVGEAFRQLAQDVLWFAVRQEPAYQEDVLVATGLVSSSPASGRSTSSPGPVRTWPDSSRNVLARLL